MVLRQLDGLDAIDRIEELRVKIVDPELVEVAEDHEWRTLWNNVRPVIERLIVVSLEFLAARFHFDKHAIRPEKIGELLSALSAKSPAGITVPGYN